MAKEHYRNITVARIIECADIGRSTFYAHFETKDELLEAMCTEMFDHVFEGVNTHCITHAELEANDLEGRLAHLVYHLRDTHDGICGKLLKEGEPHFTRYFRGRLSLLFERTMPDVPRDVPHDLMIELLVSSFCSAVVWWFGQKGACDPERLARWFLMPIGRESHV